MEIFDVLLRLLIWLLVIGLTYAYILFSNVRETLSSLRGRYEALLDNYDTDIGKMLDYLLSRGDYRSFAEFDLRDKPASCDRSKGGE